MWEYQEETVKKDKTLFCMQKKKQLSHSPQTFV